MSHSFFFEEGSWTASGLFMDEDGTPLPVEGRTEVVHDGGKWIIDGRLKISVEHAAEFENKYEVEPVPEGGDTARWSSFNPILGECRGKLTVVHDSFISNFVSENGEYKGQEFLVRIKDDVYLNRGVLLKGGRRVSSWAVELRRQGPAG